MTTSDEFKSAEARYYEARGRFANGRLTRTQFEEAVRALTVRDAQGRAWRLSEGGQWQVYHGQAWIEATPGAAGSMPPPLPESRPDLPLPESRAKPPPPTGSGAKPAVLTGSDAKPPVPTGSDAKPQVPTGSDAKPPVPTGERQGVNPRAEGTKPAEAGWPAAPAGSAPELPGSGSMPAMSGSDAARPGSGSMPSMPGSPATPPLPGSRPDLGLPERQGDAPQMAGSTPPLPGSRPNLGLPERQGDAPQMAGSAPVAPGSRPDLGLPERQGDAPQMAGSAPVAPGSRPDLGLPERQGDAPQMAGSAPVAPGSRPDLGLPERSAQAGFVGAGAPPDAPLPGARPGLTGRKQSAGVPWVLLLLVVLLLGVVVAAAGLALNPGALALLTSGPGGAPAAATAAPNAAQSPAASLAPTPPTPTLRPQPPTATPALATSNVPGTKVSVVNAPTAAPVAAKDFAALNASLAQKIAALNQAELKFIRDARGSALNGRPGGVAMPASQKGSLTDEDIKDMAGKAMDVAILSDQLGELGAKQNKGSPAAQQSIEPYIAIARQAYSLVADSQTVRQGLQNGTLPLTNAIDRISSYGAGLWNSAVTDGSTNGNPFTPQVKNAEPNVALNPDAARAVQAQTNGGSGGTWIAQSNTKSQVTLNIPAATSPVGNPFDPQVKSALASASGQEDGNKAQQVASANLQKLGASATSNDTSKPTQLTVPVSPVAVAGGEQVKAGNVPSFSAGKATIAGQGAPGDDPFMQSVGLNGPQTPSDQGKTTVQDAPALVALTLSNIVITSVNKRPKGSGSFEADANFSFSVSWSTNLASPQFKLNCNGHNEATITTASGSLAQSANGLLILYPGTLTVYCYANSANGQSLGSVSVNVLVGDAADATTRALQVETDAAILNITLTADAQGTLSAQQTQTASAQQTQTAVANATANAQKTIDAVSTEVAGTATAEFKLTAAAFATKQAQPPPATSTPTATPTFAPKVIDQLSHGGNVFAVSTNVVLQRGRLYRFTFSGRINLINPTRSVSANQLPDHVNGVAVPASGIVVIEGTGGKATITCGSGDPDPKDPGAFGITVEDLGPG